MDKTEYLSIPNTKVGSKEFRFRQVSLYLYILVLQMQATDKFY
jgi:hypothetical protein